MKRSLPNHSHLDLLAEMSRRFAASLDIQQTIRDALRSVTQYLNAEGGSLFLLNEDGSQLVCKSCLSAVDITGIAIPADAGIVGHCVQTRQALIIADTTQDTRFLSQVDDDSGFVTRSILCAPLTVNDECLGALEVVNKRDDSGQFTESDLAMLQILASSVALAILNARMSLELLDQERVKHEVRLAAEIQRNLLPRSRAAPFPVSGMNLPARSVSGDFYDYLEPRPGLIYFSIGDVSGKGMNAALLMSKTASLFRCLGKDIIDPALLVEKINAELCETTTAGMFVTMIVGLLDRASNSLKLLNCGHPPALLVSPQGVTKFPALLPPLGIAPLQVLPEAVRETRHVPAGSTLYLYTDGIIEARATSGNQLGIDGLETLLANHSGQPLHDRLAAVAHHLQPQSGARLDDMTLLAVTID